MQRYRWLVPIGLVLILVLSSCSLPGATLQQNTNSSSTPAQTLSNLPVAAQPGSLITSTTDLETLVESIYNQVNPSVVNVQVVLPVSLSNPDGGALGSGFVWDDQGDLVTNNHVIDGATRITVTFYDGSTVDASLVGTDSDSDLAVIKLKTNSIRLQPVTLADSTQLKVGQLAIAIGNPFGLQSTLTVGFVSGLGRLLPADQNAIGATYSIPDVIQTDASLNPGNSGGVLLNDTGKVIGITNSIATTSGSSSGVGFAIPSAIIQQVIPSLIKSGHYDHPYLGVSVGSLNPDLAGAMNLPSDQRGALVQSVAAGGPAEKAGLQASAQQVTINGQPVSVGGDVIVAYNGQTVKSSDDLVTFLARSGAVGQTATLTVLRAGKSIQIQVTLAARPSS